MTREEARGRLMRILTEAIEFENSVCYVTEEDREPLEIAIKALEQEPCEDCISRQVAIDAFERFIHEVGIEDEPYNYGEMALSIENVPPVTPQPKTGHWIKRPNGFKCSKCLVVHKYHAIYCPSCGVRMVESPESEDNE